MVLKRTTVAARKVTSSKTAGRPVKVTEIRVTPKKTATKTSGKTERKSKDFDFSAYFDYTVKVLTNPSYVIFFVCAAYLCFNYMHEHSNSHLWTFVQNFVNKFTTFKTSACSILNMMLCFVPFIPAIVSVPSKNRSLTIICTIAYYMFIPERTPYEYLAHGIIVFLILKTNNQQYRMIGVALLFLTYIMQFVIPLPMPDVSYVCNGTSLVAAPKSQ
ncbi:ORF3 [Tanay virus]|uniref:ORF3 n=1 Tax=Tanay virus TaxID=1489714 RepID=UPI000455FF59|nr:ORF3 [Tanay virus]AHX42601.1 ORF3 [Tanay virus]AHX42607.1 ORF3 [Tanay virus]